MRSDEGVIKNKEGEKKSKEQQTNMRVPVHVFHFYDNKSPQSIVTFIILCQNWYLPIADADGIEGKFAMGVIFRCVFDLPDLPPACIRPSNTEGGVEK